MPIPVRDLLMGKPAPVTIWEEATVEEAIERLLSRDFNQLPVVDSAGRLKGILSEQTLLRTYFHSEGDVNLYKLMANHCQEEATTLGIDDDLTEVLDVLQDRKNYAIIVTDPEQRPVGIITHYDMTSYFRNVSEALIYIENIEHTLRRYIETVFPTPEARKKAVILTFGYDRKRDHRPARRYHLLSFNSHVKLILDDDNWPEFQGVFEPKPLFANLMKRVGHARNKLAHFRGELTNIEYDGLKAARDWLVTRPAPISPGVGHEK